METVETGFPVFGVSFIFCPLPDFSIAGRSGRFKGRKTDAGVEVDFNDKQRDQDRI